MHFTKALLTLASMASTIAAPTATNSSITVVGEWREKFVRTEDTQTYCKFNGGVSSFLSFPVTNPVQSRTNVSSLAASSTLIPASLLESCKELADYFREHHGYYQASGWSKVATSELVGFKDCHIRMANEDNGNTVNIGNGDLASFMDEVFGLRDDARVAALGEMVCPQARLTVSVSA